MEGRLSSILSQGSPLSFEVGCFVETCSIGASMEVEGGTIPLVILAASSETATLVSSQSPSSICEALTRFLIKDIPLMVVLSARERVSCTSCAEKNGNCAPLLKKIHSSFVLDRRNNKSMKLRKMLPPQSAVGSYPAKKSWVAFSRDFNRSCLIVFPTPIPTITRWKNK